MPSFWSDACNYADNIKTLQTKLDASRASCSVTVRYTTVAAVCFAADSLQSDA